MIREVTTDYVKAGALALGFDDCKVASVDQERDDGFDAWIAAGYHADMDWLARTRALRQSAALQLPGVQSVVVLARYYYRRDAAAAAGHPEIARYAWSRDYHRALRKPLRQLAGIIEERVPDARCYASVDSGPVRERVWAARSGLAWIGRNGLAIHPRFGSWFFLATILTTASLEPDAPLPERCGNCRACMEACPTGALVAERVVDSRRCLAWHTIENRNAIPESIAENMGGRLFGCDACQICCPWNQPHRLDGEASLAIRDRFASLEAAHLAEISDADFLEWFQGTPVMRARAEGMRRNARIVLRNTCGDARRDLMPEPE